MKAQNLTDVTRILTQNNYDFLEEFHSQHSKKTFLLFQPLDNNDYNIDKIQRLIGNKFYCHIVYNIYNYKQIVVFRKDN